MVDICLLWSPDVPPPFSPTGETRARVYRYVRQRLAQGDPPTVREVQAAFGFRAVETARKHLEQLVADGLLAKRSGGTARGYCLPAAKAAPAQGRSPQQSRPPEPVQLVPLLGRVAAGALQEAIENHEGSVPVAGRDRDHGRLFALRVEGESMRDAGILPGDLVLVRAQPTARSGDIVVALVEDEATVKTFVRRGNRIELRPHNPAFAPIVPDPERLTILGKVLEVRRDLSR